MYHSSKIDMMVKSWNWEVRGAFLEQNYVICFNSWINRSLLSFIVFFFFFFPNKLFRINHGGHWYTYVDRSKVCFHLHIIIPCKWKMYLTFWMLKGKSLWLGDSWRLFTESVTFPVTEAGFPWGKPTPQPLRALMEETCCVTTAGTLWTVLSAGEP